MNASAMTAAKKQHIFLILFLPGEIINIRINKIISMGSGNKGIWNLFKIRLFLPRLREGIKSWQATMVGKIGHIYGIYRIKANRHQSIGNLCLNLRTIHTIKKYLEKALPEMQSNNVKTIDNEMNKPLFINHLLLSSWSNDKISHIMTQIGPEQFGDVPPTIGPIPPSS